MIRKNAIVEFAALEFIPLHEATREQVVSTLNQLAAQIKRTQDEKSGLWYQVINRSGDYNYYTNETIRSNNPKAIAPFIMASLEWERLQKCCKTKN